MKSKNSNKLIAILNKNSKSELNEVKFYDSRDLTNDTTKHKHVTINNINSRLTLYTTDLNSFSVGETSLINITNEFNSRILGTDDLNKLYVENYSNSRFFIRKDVSDTSNLPVSYCNYQRNGNIYIDCKDEFNKCLIDHTYITSEEQKITDLNWYSLTIDYNDVELENIFNGYISFNNFEHDYSTLSSIKSISNVDCTICISPTNDLKIENISLANLAINQNYFSEPEKIPTISFTNINNAYITGYKRAQILTDINGMNGVNSIISIINLKNSKKISLNNCKITTTDYNFPVTIISGNYTDSNDVYSLKNLKDILNKVTQYDSNIKHSSYFHTHYQLNPLNKTWFYNYVFSGYISEDIINFKVGPDEGKLFVTIGDILFGTTTKTNFRRCDGSKLLNSFEDQFSTDYTYDYYINTGTWQLPTVGAVQIAEQVKR